MSTPVRVVVDAGSLSDQSAYSGIGSYVRHILGALVGRDDVRITALATSDVRLPDGVESAVVRRWARAGRLSVWEHQARLPAEVWRAGADVFHSPHPHAPLVRRGPWVQTLHDLIPLTYDDPGLAPLRTRFKRFGPRYVKADAVIAVSRYAADEAIRVLGLQPERIHVAHHGVSPEFHPGSTAEKGEDGPPFLLLVGEYQPRKGFQDAFAVAGALAEAGYPCRLRVAGRVPPWARDAVAALVERSPRPDRIEVLGFVDDLPALYRRASVVVVPSHCEGFGLPAVEAMATGTPVVAYANTSLPEVVGDGGVLVADRDVAAMTAAVRRILDDPALAADLSHRGLERAREFDWNRSAAVHAEVYRAVAR